jgi:hypothetical protein
MTERKPLGVTWESWVDGQIRRARERGEFDNLPGTGKPIPNLDGPEDEMWWVKSLLKREGVSFLPDTLKLRKDVEEAREQIASAPNEAEVRDIVGAINIRIRETNRRATSGPPSSQMPLDIDTVLAKWREQRGASES